MCGKYQDWLLPDVAEPLGFTLLVTSWARAGNQGHAWVCLQKTRHRKPGVILNTWSPLIVAVVSTFTILRYPFPPLLSGFPIQKRLMTWTITCDPPRIFGNLDLAHATAPQKVGSWSSLSWWGWVVKYHQSHQWLEHRVWRFGAAPHFCWINSNYSLGEVPLDCSKILQSKPLPEQIEHPIQKTIDTDWNQTPILKHQPFQTPIEKQVLDHIKTSITIKNPFKTS